VLARFQVQAERMRGNYVKLLQATFGSIPETLNGADVRLLLGDSLPL
jgi:hypothetical protein